MRLAIDAVGNQSGGGATVLLDLLREAECHARTERVVVFTSPRQYRTFDFPQSARINEIPQPRAHRAAMRPAWHLHFLHRAAVAAGADVVLCMNGMGYGKGLPFVHFVQQSLPFSREAIALALEVHHDQDTLAVGKSDEPPRDPHRDSPT